jgi:hypothetical protein
MLVINIIFDFLLTMGLIVFSGLVIAMFAVKWSKNHKLYRLDDINTCWDVASGHA